MTTLYYVYVRGKTYPVALCKSLRDAESITQLIELYRCGDHYPSGIELINTNMNLLDDVEDVHFSVDDVEFHFENRSQYVPNNYTKDYIYYGFIDISEFDRSEIQIINCREESISFITDDDIEKFMDLENTRIVKLHAVRDYDFCKEQKIPNIHQIKHGYSNKSLTDVEIDFIYNFKHFEDDVFLIPWTDASLNGANKAMTYI